MPILIKGSGGKKAKLQPKSTTPTKSEQTIMPDSGFDGLSQCKVYPIPSSYVSPSYTQSSKTWTPGTSNQYISSGTYCSGLQTIKGDSNLVASNIKKGVSIFGISGNHETQINATGKIGNIYTGTCEDTGVLEFYINTTNLIGFVLFFNQASPPNSTVSRVSSIFSNRESNITYYTNVFINDSDDAESDLVTSGDLSVTYNTSGITISNNNSRTYLSKSTYTVIPFYKA